MTATPAARPRLFGARDAAIAIAIGSIVVAAWIWAAGRGIRSLGDPVGGVGSLGLLTGLLSADLMLVQVVMLARVPWIERSWGHGALTRWHRYAGYASFWLMIAHVALFVLDRLSRTERSAARSMLRLFVLDPWMLWATIGTAFLVAVVATSIRAARRRLRYESWHLIHLYAYLGMAFALPHMLADGPDFRGVAAQAYWWSLYGIALACLLAFRVGLPIVRSVRHRLRVERVDAERPGVVSVTISGVALDRLGTRSGQFFIWRFLGGLSGGNGHPFTISAAPHPQRLRVTIQAVGDGSERAARLEPGTRVLVEGPYGTMTAERRTREKALFLAAGIGITPLRALLEDMPFAPGDATLIYRYSREGEAVLRDELDGIAARRGVVLHYLPGHRDGRSWLPIGGGTLASLVPDVAERDIFACGPAGWLDAAVSDLRASGVPARQIQSEAFAW